MASILKFTDEEKKRVGLGPAVAQSSGGIKGRIAAIASFIPNVLFPEVCSACALQPWGEVITQR